MARTASAGATAEGAPDVPGWRGDEAGTLGGCREAAPGVLWGRHPTDLPRGFIVATSDKSGDTTGTKPASNQASTKPAANQPTPAPAQSGPTGAKDDKGGATGTSSTTFDQGDPNGEIKRDSGPVEVEVGGFHCSKCGQPVTEKNEHVATINGAVSPSTHEGMAVADDWPAIQDAEDAKAAKDRGDNDDQEDHTVTVK